MKEELKKKDNRFWYLLEIEEFLTKAELQELRDLYDELYEYFDAGALEYIEIVSDVL